nr:hypothetical protein [Planctomycetota bacterium]
MRTRFALGLIMVMALALPSARAEEELEPQAWPDEVPLERLLRQVSSLLDAPIVWNPDDRELARTRIIGKLKLSFAGTPRSERVDVVRAVLRFYEFDLVRCEPREQPVYVLTRFETPRGQWRPEPLSLDDGALRTAMQQSGRLVA